MGILADFVYCHFMQTGEAAGIPSGMTKEIMSELAERVPVALETTRQALPPSFPEPILNSISAGILHRARQLETEKHV